MKKINALTVRQALGRVLRDLDRSGEPILVEKGREPRAVLISLRDFRERFVDKVAAEERRRVVDEILRLRTARRTADRRSSVELLRDLRGGLESRSDA